MPKPNDTRNVPAYTHHKPTGQARVRINGKDHYLGKFNTVESLRRYDELIAVYLRDRSVEGHLMTVDELAVKFVAHALKRYQKHGEPTGRRDDFAKALKPLCREFGRLRVVDFGPLKLKVFRRTLVERGYVRSSINAYVSRILQAFAWAVSEELIPETVHRALTTVAPLRFGEARDNPPVAPVPVDAVEAAEPFMSPEVRAMVRFQLYTAARPGEARILRPSDIDIAGDIWKYTPKRHKTEHHGKCRVVYIGPRGQEVVSAFWPAEDTAYFFQPQNKGGKRTDPRPFTCTGYAEAVRLACRKAGIKPWNPNRLRHTAATFIRKEFDVETARIILGHGSLRVTEIYAERDERLALQAMQQMG